MLCCWRHPLKKQGMNLEFPTLWCTKSPTAFYGREVGLNCDHIHPCVHPRGCSTWVELLCISTRESNIRIEPVSLHSLLAGRGPLPTVMVPSCSDRISLADLQRKEAGENQGLNILLPTLTCRYYHCTAMTWVCTSSPGWRVCISEACTVLHDQLIK